MDTLCPLSAFFLLLARAGLRIGGLLVPLQSAFTFAALALEMAEMQNYVA